MQQSSLLLASGSETRRTMLAAAGLPIDPVRPLVDEEAIKEALLEEGAGPLDLAMALAEVKALSVARLYPDKLVLGADQILDLGGEILSKASTKAEAITTLQRLSGKSHRLLSAAVIAKGPDILWRGWDKASLTVRPLSDDFINRYLEDLGEAAFTSVGCYHLEGRGAQLFEKVDGDYYTILGLPLLQIFKYLRESGGMSA